MAHDTVTRLRFTPVDPTRDHEDETRGCEVGKLNQRRLVAMVRVNVVWRTVTTVELVLTEV